MSRAAVIHFDGDPILMGFWLKLYEMYWRTEVDKIYAKIAYRPELVPLAIIENEKALFAKYPEIETFWQANGQPPEVSNNQLIPLVKEDKILLTESDNWIFEKGLVNGYFDKLDKYNLIGAEYTIIPPKWWEEFGRGWMRSFFFVNKSLLDQIEIDFLPRQVEGEDMDCFSYIALQLAKLKPKALNIPNHNLNPEKVFDSNLYKTGKWVHIRQMSSSVLGFGSMGFEDFRDDNQEAIDRVLKAIEGEAGRWQYIKAVAFRYLMLDIVGVPENAIGFYNSYRLVIDKVVNICRLDKMQINSIYYYYKGLMGI